MFITYFILLYLEKYYILKLAIIIYFNFKQIYINQLFFIYIINLGTIPKKYMKVYFYNYSNTYIKVLRYSF